MFKQWRLTRRIDVVLMLVGLVACGLGSVLFVLCLQGNGLSFESARQILPAFLVGTAAVVVVVVVSTRVLLRRFVLDPLERISTFSREVSLGNLDVRLDVPATDEIGEIGSAFNRMRRSVVRGIDLLRDVHLERGRSLIEQGDAGGALSEFQAALGIDPDNIEARSELARSLAFSGEIAAAIDHYRQILRSQPEDPCTQFNLGLLLAAGGEAKQAALRFNTALALFEARHAQAEVQSVKSLLADLDDGQDRDLRLLKPCRTEARAAVVPTIVAPAPTLPWRNIGALGGSIAAVCALAFLVLRPASPPSVGMDSALLPVAEPPSVIEQVAAPIGGTAYRIPDPAPSLPAAAPSVVPATVSSSRPSGAHKYAASRATRARSKIRSRPYVAVRRRTQSRPVNSVATVSMADKAPDCYSIDSRSRDYRCRNRKN